MKKKSKKVHYRNDEFLLKIGERIRELRLQKNLTQMELAFKCNDADYSQINRIELGKVNFSASYLFLLAEALEVPIVELLPNKK